MDDDLQKRVVEALRDVSGCLNEAMTPKYSAGWDAWKRKANSAVSQARTALAEVERQSEEQE